MSAVGHGHGHGHGHGAGDRRIEAAAVRRGLVAVVVAVAAAAVVGLALWWPGGDPDVDREVLGFGSRVEGDGHLGRADRGVGDPAVRCNVVRAQVTSGPEAGDSATFEATLDVDTPAAAPPR